jgi:lysophospholipase L1-like esterase
MMRALAPVLALVGCVAAAAAGCSGQVPAAPVPGRPASLGGPPASYYLALGDSLAQGVQPGSSGASAETAEGYPDQLYAALRTSHPGLRLVKLGCPGETTATMISGGICPYASGSQLAAAAGFLRAHRGRVRLITIDIGANDPSVCVFRPSAATLASCVLRSIPVAAANLAKILTHLRGAAAGTRIVAMNYYLPALAQWRHGLVGRALARLSELAAAGYNTVLTRVFQASGVPVADVFTAFHTPDFGDQVTLAGIGRLPRNVAVICQWTWECAAPPRGPNEHPNPAGYAVIARSFLAAGAR